MAAMKRLPLHRTFIRASLGGLLLAASATAWAAGGHHAIDDADILEPGGCKVESWYERNSAPGRLLHLGFGCRVGPVELTASTEPQRQAGTSLADHELQVKWATQVATGLKAGVSLAPTWQSHARPRYQGTALVGLLTWEPFESVGVHANVGRDFVHRGRDQGRGGVSADWSPGGGPWKLVAERYREQGSHFARAGVRWTVAEGWLLDLSRAVRLRGPGDHSWTLGLTREFQR